MSYVLRGAQAGTALHRTKAGAMAGSALLRR